MSVSFKGTVKNGVVVLPSDAKLPDGTSVEVIPEELQSEEDPFDAAVRKVAKPRPRNLDHYLYGAPKRS